MSWPLRRCHQKSGSRMALVTGNAAASMTPLRNSPPGDVSLSSNGSRAPPAWCCGVEGCAATGPVLVTLSAIVTREWESWCPRRGSPGRRVPRAVADLHCVVQRVMQGLLQRLRLEGLVHERDRAEVDHGLHVVVEAARGEQDDGDRGAAPGGRFHGFATPPVLTMR